MDLLYIENVRFMDGLVADLFQLQGSGVPELNKYANDER